MRLDMELDQMPNNSLQPTRGRAVGLSGTCRSFCVAVPAWLSSSR